MRPAAIVLGSLLALPAAASAVVVLALPPVADALPAPVASALAPVAALVFRAVAALPPDSAAGWAFHASYAPLVPVFGAHALVAHAVLLGLAWLAIAASAVGGRRLLAAVRP